MTFLYWLLWRVQLLFWTLEEDATIYTLVSFWATLFFALLAAVNFAEERKELTR